MGRGRFRGSSVLGDRRGSWVRMGLGLALVGLVVGSGIFRARLGREGGVRRRDVGPLGVVGEARRRGLVVWERVEGQVDRSVRLLSVPLLVGVSRGCRRTPTSFLVGVRFESLALEWMSLRWFARPRRSWPDGGNAAAALDPSMPSALPVPSGSARPTWRQGAVGSPLQWTSCHPELVPEEHLFPLYLPVLVVLAAA